MNLRAVLLFLVVVGCTAADLDANRQADALRLREGFRGVDGALGEVGPYQLRQITWRQHMPGVPFSQARIEATARACALKHIRWISAELERAGVPASSFNVAAAWNAGLERYLSGRAPERAYRFAGDVERIYFSSFPKKEPMRFLIREQLTSPVKKSESKPVRLPVTITRVRPFVIQLPASP